MGERVKGRRSKMEEVTAVWECRVGDRITMSVETGCLDKPNGVVRGEVVQIPTRAFTFSKGAKYEMITLDDEPHSIDTVIDIKHAPAQIDRSPASTRNAHETALSPPRRRAKARAHIEVHAPSPEVQPPSNHRNNLRSEEHDSDSDSSESDIEPIPFSEPAVPLAQEAPKAAPG